MSEQLAQRFLSNETMTFDELMALLSWAAIRYDVADLYGNKEKKKEMSKLSLAVRPACVRAEMHGTSFLNDRTRTQEAQP